MFSEAKDKQTTKEGTTKDSTMKEGTMKYTTMKEGTLQWLCQIAQQSIDFS